MVAPFLRRGALHTIAASVTFTHGRSLCHVYIRPHPLSRYIRPHPFSVEARSEGFIGVEGDDPSIYWASKRSDGHSYSSKQARWVSAYLATWLRGCVVGGKVVRMVGAVLPTYLRNPPEQAGGRHQPTNVPIYPPTLPTYLPTLPAYATYLLTCLPGRCHQHRRCLRHRLSKRTAHRRRRVPHAPSWRCHWPAHWPAHWLWPALILPIAHWPAHCPGLPRRALSRPGLPRRALSRV